LVLLDDLRDKGPKQARRACGTEVATKVEKDVKSIRLGVLYKM
jgi:hypothetical protein